MVHDVNNPWAICNGTSLSIIDALLFAIYRESHVHFRKHMKEFIKSCVGFETSYYESLGAWIWMVFYKHIWEDALYIPTTSSNAIENENKYGTYLQRIVAILCMCKGVVFLL